MVSQIYPSELQLNKANTSDTEAAFSRRWLFNKYIFNCILLSIDIHNAYICIQNSIGMFQVGVERWFVLSIEAILKRFSF